MRIGSVCRARSVNVVRVNNTFSKMDLIGMSTIRKLVANELPDFLALQLLRGSSSCNGLVIIHRTEKLFTTFWKSVVSLLVLFVIVLTHL